MNKKCLGMLLVLCFVCLIGSLIVVPKSLSVSTMEISKDGYYTVKGGTSIHLNGISCSTVHDYSSGFESITMTTDCGGTNYTIPTLKSDYLFVVKDTGNSCSGMQVGSPSKMDADCYVYNYDKPTASISCNKNTIASGEVTSCTLKVVTSSDGFKSLNVNIDSDNLSASNFTSDYATVTNIGNDFVFTANQTLDTKKEYILGNFNVTNVGVDDGVDNSIKFNYTYNDNIASLNIGSSSLSFSENSNSTTTEKVTTTENTKANTTTKTVITKGVDSSDVNVTDEVIPTTTMVSTDSSGDLVIDTDTKASPKTDDESTGIKGSTAVLLTTFVSTMSIAAGIGIVLLSKKFKI